MPPSIRRATQPPIDRIQQQTDNVYANVYVPVTPQFDRKLLLVVSERRNAPRRAHRFPGWLAHSEPTGTVGNGVMAVHYPLLLPPWGSLQTVRTLSTMGDANAHTIK